MKDDLAVLSRGATVAPRQMCRQEKGATLIEFALILPLLLLLILGIVEFGWLFGQYNDVRHGAREGARFAAVDAGAFNDILAHVCSSMDGLSGGMSAIQVTMTADGGTRGTEGAIRITATVDSLSRAPLITSFLPDQLESEVQFRLEQDSAGWGAGESGSC